MAAANQSDRSPVPGIIPEPVHISGDAAPPNAATERRTESKLGAPKLRGRNPVRDAIAKIASAVRGDKYMIGAYPAADREDAAASDDPGPRARER